MIFGTWQIVYLAIVALGLGISIATHGQTRQENFWWTLIGTGLTLAILYMGGFF